MDQAIKQFDAKDVTKQPQPVKGHSGAVEKIEWILGKLVQYAPQATALAYPSFYTVLPFSSRWPGRPAGTAAWVAVRS